MGLKIGAVCNPNEFFAAALSQLRIKESLLFLTQYVELYMHFFEFRELPTRQFFAINDSIDVSFSQDKVASILQRRRERKLIHRKKVDDEGQVSTQTRSVPR